MSCCASKRERLRYRWAISALRAEAAQTPARPGTPVVFKGKGEYLVTGQHSGHVYHFSTEQPELWIDANDAKALLITELFQKGDKAPQ